MILQKILSYLLYFVRELVLLKPLLSCYFRHISGRLIRTRQLGPDVSFWSSYLKEADLSMSGKKTRASNV